MAPGQVRFDEASITAAREQTSAPAMPRLHPLQRFPSGARFIEYPKTKMKLKQLAHNVRMYARQFHRDYPHLEVPQTFSFVGTTKLHGRHGDIVRDCYGKIGFQSRFRVLTPENDNAGFAAFCVARLPVIHRLFDRIERRFCELNPEAGEPKTILLAGEWVGQGVQDGTALAQLTPCFALFGIRVSDLEWEKFQHYANISCPDDQIFSICRGGTFFADFTVADDGQQFQVFAMRYTHQVARECPFAKSFDVVGEGEGIVWTPSTSSPMPNKDAYWLKTEGARFRGVPQLERLEREMAHTEERERVAAFVRAACSTSRLQQGLRAVVEQGRPLTRRSVGPFILWMQSDIAVEQKDEIEEQGWAETWRKHVAKFSRIWYHENVPVEDTDG